MAATSAARAIPAPDRAAERPPQAAPRRRAKRRRARLMVVCSLVLIIGAVFVVGLGQNLVGSEQIRLDSLQQQLTTARQANENLLLQRAQLAASARILQLAERKLGMVNPSQVIYLTPVATGKTVAEASREAARATHR